MKTRLKSLRKVHELTQLNVAKILNVKSDTYSKWENQINDMPLEKCNELANLYDVSIDYLLGLSNKGQYNNHLSIINYDLLRQRLKNLRIKNKLSQAKLSDKLGIYESTYCSYEKLTYVPTTFKLYTIASFYKCSIDFLLGRIDDSMMGEDENITNNTNKEVLIKFKLLRKQYKLKQSDVANAIGVKCATYHQWETLTNSISLNNCNKLANYYNVSMDYLLGLSNDVQYDNHRNFINFQNMRENLKKLRKDKGLSQKDLCKEIGIQQTTYSNYEKGNIVPNTFRLLDIISYYNISMDYILGRVDENYLENKNKN